MLANPFTLTFGKVPLVFIERPVQDNEILDTFTSDAINQQMFIITGVRASGKTVMMSKTCHELSKHPDWIVLELNPATDLLQSILSKLYSNHLVSKLIKSSKIDLSFFGFGVSIDGATQITDSETAIVTILKKIQKEGKRVLFCIDEMSNNEYMKIFAGSFQIFVRQELPVFLLGTGLYENIDELQNEKNLTFLYRAPKIQLQPLNISAIEAKYQRIFQFTDSKASEMAKLTKGYPFAFQVLGYLTWNAGGDYRSVLNEYEQYLSEFVYDKLWSELSSKDRLVAKAIVDTDSRRIKDIREILNMSTNEFNPYRQRLIKKGIVDGSTRGYLYFTLPLFEECINTHFDID